MNMVQKIFEKRVDRARQVGYGFADRRRETGLCALKLWPVFQPFGYKRLKTVECYETYLEGSR